MIMLNIFYNSISLTYIISLHRYNTMHWLHIKKKKSCLFHFVSWFSIYVEPHIITLFDASIPNPLLVWQHRIHLNFPVGSVTCSSHSLQAKSFEMPYIKKKQIKYIICILISHVFLKTMAKSNSKLDLLIYSAA